MSYNKNTAGQKFNVLAVNSGTGLPVTGDAANITAQISKDFGAFVSLVDTNPTELDSTNAPGVYVFDLSQAETNADVLTIVPTSTTANVEMDMLNIYTSEAVDNTAIANAVLAGGDIDGYSMEEALKICAAVLAGKVSGAGTNTVTFRAADDSKDRIVATVTGDGNRLSVTIDATG